MKIARVKLEQPQGGDDQEPQERPAIKQERPQGGDDQEPQNPFYYTPNANAAMLLALDDIMDVDEPPQPPQAPQGPAIPNQYNLAGDGEVEERRRRRAAAANQPRAELSDDEDYQEPPNIDARNAAARAAQGGDIDLVDDPPQPPQPQPPPPQQQQPQPQQPQQQQQQPQQPRTFTPRLVTALDKQQPNPGATFRPIRSTSIAGGVPRQPSPLPRPPPPFPSPSPTPFEQELPFQELPLSPPPPPPPPPPFPPEPEGMPPLLENKRTRSFTRPSNKRSPLAGDFFGGATPEQIPQKVEAAAAQVETQPYRTVEERKLDRGDPDDHYDKTRRLLDYIPDYSDLEISQEPGFGLEEPEQGEIPEYFPRFPPEDLGPID